MIEAVAFAEILPGYGQHGANMSMFCLQIAGDDFKVKIFLVSPVAQRYGNLIGFGAPSGGSI